MKAKVSSSNQKLFNPYFKAILGGKQVDISLEDFMSNPYRYISTGVSYLYDNEDEIREYLAKNVSKVKAEILDMSAAKRGTAFSNESKNKASNEAKNLIVEQLKRRKRIQQRFEKNKKSEAEKKAAKDASKK